MFVESLFWLAVLALVGLGAFLVIGTLQGRDVLLRAPDARFGRHYQTVIRRLFGDRGVYYYNILVGIVFIVFAIAIVVYAYTFR